MGKRTGNRIGLGTNPTSSVANGSWSLGELYVSRRRSNWPEQIVRSGLVLLLDAGVPESYPGSGTTWTDLSGNGNNGTLTNGPTYSSSNGGSIVFDGTNDYVLGNTTSPLPAGSSARTIECVCTPSLINTTRNILNYGGTAAGSRINIVNTSNEVSIALSGHRYGKSGLSLTGFNCITFVYPNSSTSSSSWLIYLNGQQLTGLQNLAGLPVTMNTLSVQTFYLGSSLGSSEFHNGQIASTKLYNRALSLEEINQNFNALRSRYGI